MFWNIFLTTNMVGKFALVKNIPKSDSK